MCEGVNKLGWMHRLKGIEALGIFETMSPGLFTGEEKFTCSAALVFSMGHLGGTLQTRGEV